MTVTIGTLCTGVGGLDLGINAAYGGNTAITWYSEVNPDACTVLAARLPGVANLGDLTAVDWAQVPRVDLISAGFPCQPVSAAGKQKATDDQRWLWPHVRACYQALRPQELVFENVRNLVSIRKGALFAEICQNLRDDGYAVRWGLAGACAVGGAHHRHRVFLVARYAWQLTAPAAERVDMIECGARRGRGRLLLPTPTASPYGRNRGGADPGGPVRWSLDSAHLLLPTPTTSDGMGGPGNSGRDGGDNLRTAAATLGDDTAALLLPSPRARDGHGGDSDTERQQARRERSAFGGPSLPDVVQQTLLPTPTVADSRNSRNATANRTDPAGGNGQFTLCDTTHDVDAGHGLRGPGSTADASALLPTPRHSDAAKGSPNQHGSAGDLMLPSAVIGARYGRYAHAVALWEHLCATPAPEPTVLNKAGQWRLNPALPEWMMGYPAGWITDLVGRSAALRCAGNGVVAQVVAAVYPILTAGWPYLRGGEVCPDPITTTTRATAARPAGRTPGTVTAEQLALLPAG